eukprot:tig00020961_g16730.t1
MVSDIPGMKVLLLDTETTGIVSMVYSQSQILQKEVFLVEYLSRRGREKMLHLKAVCFLRPTSDNIALLVEELKDPRYGEYHLYFSNILRTSYIEQLAEADEQEVVKHVQELYADYYAVNVDTFTLNIDSCVCLLPPNWDELVFQRICDGLTACLLSLKKKPVVRYQHSSQLCRKLANDIMVRMEEERALFDFRKADVPPLLLLLDRRDDPVTPLLNQWTYQAMVHELLGVKNNRVRLAGVPGVKKELEEVVLSPIQDQFYRENLHVTFGDLGASVKGMVDEYQKKTKRHQKVESIADMQKFVEDYPEFKKLSGSVSKHVALIGELSRLVDARCLLDCSEVEQELACQENHNSAAQRVSELLAQPKIDPWDKLRLVMLYALRYHGHAQSQVQRLCQVLAADARWPQLQADRDPRLPADKLQLVDGVVRYADAALKAGELYQNKTSLKAQLEKVQRGLRGVANVYTQHQPVLFSTLQELMKGKLREQTFPLAQSANSVPPPPANRVQDVIVFVMGGITLEEARAVSQLNANTQGVRIVLGGTTVHNSRSFCGDVAAFLKLMEGKDSVELAQTEANSIPARLLAQPSPSPASRGKLVAV